MDGALERAVVDKKPVPEIDFYSSHNGRRHSGRHARGFAKVRTKDRQAVVPTEASIEVQAPAMQPPSVDQFWSPRDPSKPNLQFLK